MRTPTRHPSARPRRLPSLLALLLLLVLVGAACSSADSADSGTDEAGDVADTAAAATMAAAEEPRDDAADEAFGLADAEAPAPAEADGDVVPDAQAPVPTIDGTAATGERIIKEGTVTVEVDPGEFDGAFGQVVARAQALGGHVAGSSSSTDDEGLVSGQVTIRVPVRSFEDLLTVLGEAGTVVDRNITSTDVSAEYTDLESRRRNLQALERFYLELLEEAQSITDAITVQQELNDVQGQIEQITGRLNLLQDRSAFSTLTVRIRELGADATVEVVADGGFGEYLTTAKETLVGTLGTLLVVATFALPFLVLAGIGTLVWRLVRRRSARPAAPLPAPPATTTPTAPTAPEEAPTPVEPVGTDA